MRTPNHFIDPQSGLDYAWDVNHSEEDGIERRRNIENTAPTAGLGLIKQQGDDSPMLIRLNGTILTVGQHQQFINFTNISRTRTVIYRDFSGDEYEVIITSYAPKRERVLKNPRGGVPMEHYVIRYSIEMQVLAIRAGLWVGTNP